MCTTAINMAMGNDLRYEPPRTFDSFSQTLSHGTYKEHPDFRETLGQEIEAPNRCHPHNLLHCNAFLRLKTTHRRQHSCSHMQASFELKFLVSQMLFEVVVDKQTPYKQFASRTSKRLRGQHTLNETILHITTGKGGICGRKPHADLDLQLQDNIGKALILMRCSRLTHLIMLVM